MTDAKVHAGGCHCGRVRYEATTDPAQAIACNCSICAKHGLWLAFVKSADFKMVCGLESVATYEFNKHVIQHVFCRHCGVESFARGKDKSGKDTFAINVRCLDGIDIAKLKPKPFDGRSLSRPATRAPKRSYSRSAAENIEVEWVADKRSCALAPLDRPRRIGQATPRLARLAIPQAQAIELRLDGVRAAVMGAGELRDGAAGLEGGGQFTRLALIPTGARAGRKCTLAACTRLAGPHEGVKKTLPGHHRQDQRRAMRRAETGNKPTLLHLEDVAPIALTPRDPLPHEGLLRVAVSVSALIALGHGTPPKDGWRTVAWRLEQIKNDMQSAYPSLRDESATARPIASGLSSCRKCAGDSDLGLVRPRPDDLAHAAEVMAPGSALTNSLGTSLSPATNE